MEVVGAPSSAGASRAPSTRRARGQMSPTRLPSTNAVSRSSASVNRSVSSAVPGGVDLRVVPSVAAEVADRLQWRKSPRPSSTRLAPAGLPVGKRALFLPAPQLRQAAWRLRLAGAGREAHAAVGEIHDERLAPRGSRRWSFRLARRRTKSPPTTCGRAETTCAPRAGCP